MGRDIDFKGINASLLANAKQVVSQWLPNGHMEGKEWCVGGIEGHKGRSFKVNIETGLWCDFANPDVGGRDLIDLYAAIHNLSAKDAAAALSGSVKKIKTVPKENPVSEAPVEIIPENTKSPTVDNFGHLTATYIYRNLNGEQIAHIQRYDKDGKKNILPWRMINGKIVSKHLPQPRPLYNLHDIAKRPKDPLLIVEGEKCVEAARTQFGGLVCTSWSGGTGSVKIADWGVLAKRPRAIIMPDNDEPGIKAVLELGKILLKLGIESVEVVDVSSKPEGWDIADGFNEGMSSPDMIAFIKANLKPFEEFRRSIESPEDEFIPLEEFQSADRDDPIQISVDPNDVIISPSKHVLERNSFFRFLGINGECFYFYKYRTSQIVRLTADDLGKEASLVMLADKDFWDIEMGCGGKYNTMRDTLIRISENFRYDPRLVRRVGIWKDEAGNVIHLGDRVMTEQGIVKLSEFKSSHIYEYAEKTVRIPGYRNPLPKERASKIIDFCAGSYWSDPISPRILAGWIFSSLICASIRWRSHLYIVGPAGSGKSWLMNNVVSKILGDFACQAISSSTEASIRQGLANNMVPVVFDEAEAKDMNAGARREAIFELARQASSSHENTPITKGSAGGATKDYFVRSPFLFASINANMEYADESRTTFLYLRPIPKTPEVRPKFRELNSLVRRTLTPDFHAGLLARALKLLPSMEKSFEVFSDAAYETIAQDSRHAEQMAFMIVGLWYLENDHQPDRDEAVRFVSNMTYMSQQRKATMTTEERLIAAISQCIVRYRLSNGIVEERIIGELVKTAYFEGGMGHAEDILRRYGLMTKGNRLFVCNHAENLKKSLRNTPFFNGWDKVIITIKGAKDEGTQTFMPGLIGPTVSIPMKSLIGEVNQEKSPEESF